MSNQKTYEPVAPHHSWNADHRLPHEPLNRPSPQNVSVEGLFHIADRGGAVWAGG